MRHPIHNVFYHDLDNLTIAYEYEGYDTDTDIASIYANDAKTHTGMVPTEHFCQMSLEGCAQALGSHPFQMMIIVSFMSRI